MRASPSAAAKARAPLRPAAAPPRRPDALFLCQRLPYPPNKGEKIRAYQLLRHLAGRYRVHLGCFVDDPDDESQIDALAPLCATMHVARLDRRRALIGCAGGLLGGEPLTLPYFRDRGLALWVRRMMAETAPGLVFLYSSAMAQYVLGAAAAPRLTMMDFVDVDSDKWRQYAAASRWPLRAVYRREARRLLAFDRRVAAAADFALFVSAAEAELFRSLAPESAARIRVVANGIDTAYFDPNADHPRPAALAVGGGPHLVFTGTMDYRPNVDAVRWFADEVHPRLRAARPGASFVVVGANPAPKVVELGRRPGVVVTGRVPDVRPYIAHADVCVAPMRIARGIQNKVLEAMAMAKPVVTTPEGLEGIDAVAGRDLLVAGDAAGFADAVLGALDGDRASALGRAARARVLAGHGWAAQLAALDRLLDRQAAAAD